MVLYVLCNFKDHQKSKLSEVFVDFVCN